jgi:hypothetical protein
MAERDEQITSGSANRKYVSTNMICMLMGIPLEMLHIDDMFAHGGLRQRTLNSDSSSCRSIREHGWDPSMSTMCACEAPWTDEEWKEVNHSSSHSHARTHTQHDHEHAHARSARSKNSQKARNRHREFKILFRRGSGRPPTQGSSPTKILWRGAANSSWWMGTIACSSCAVCRYENERESHVPCSLFLVPFLACSLLLAPCSWLLAPCSLLLAPCFLLLAFCSLLVRV